MTSPKRIALDEEEILMLIDFHESAANDADDSCEAVEAKRRRLRIKDLRKILNGI
jgi:hypothetical protein